MRWVMALGMSASSWQIWIFRRPFQTTPKFFDLTQKFLFRWLCNCQKFDYKRQLHPEKSCFVESCTINKFKCCTKDIFEAKIYLTKKLEKVFTVINSFVGPFHVGCYGRYQYLNTNSICIFLHIVLLGNWVNNYQILVFFAKNILNILKKLFVFYSDDVFKKLELARFLLSRKELVEINLTNENIQFKCWLLQHF